MEARLIIVNGGDYGLIKALKLHRFLRIGRKLEIAQNAKNLLETKTVARHKSS